jgi:cobalt-zinc-cadmium efflux system outer membrane protein
MILRFISRAAAATLVACSLSGYAAAQQAKALSWPEIKQKFQTTNPSLLAGKLNIDESVSEEITAFLRPNPSFSVLTDQIEVFTPSPYQPLTNLFSSFSGSYLHERKNKRELRLDSAKKGTAIAESQQADLERNLLFTLRNAFVQTLQAKAVLQLVTDNLAYYDNVLAVSRSRFKAGDIAQVDLERLELQRVQFEVAGTFDFRDDLMSLDQFRTIALETRPDLRAAMQAVEKAKVDHNLAIANGSTDPIFGADTGRNPPLNWYMGFSVTIPLRIFDKNQGEKQRTEIDITRNLRLRAAAEAQVYSDVDSAFSTLNGNLALLRVYKSHYLATAVHVRDTVSFAYQRGGSSLLDFLQAQQDYRAVQLGYLNLVGSYLTSASQLNLAVGMEAVQ